MSRLGIRIISIIVSLFLVFTVSLVSVSAVTINKIISALMEREVSTAMYLLDENIIELTNQTENTWTELSLDSKFVQSIITKNADAIENAFVATNSKGMFGAFYDNNGALIWSSSNCPSDIEKYSSYNGIASNEECLFSFYSGDIKEGEKLVGKCIVGIDFKNYDLLDKAAKAANGHFTIFHNNIRYATTITNEDGSRFEGTKMSEAIATKVIQNKEEYTGTAEINNEEYIVYYKPMYDYNDNLVGAYFSGTPTKEIKSYEKNAMIIMLIGGISFCILSAFICILIVRKFVSIPIMYIEELSNDMKSGKLSAKNSRVKLYNDEVGALAKNIEDTKGSINRYISDIANVLGAMANRDFTVQPQIEYVGDFTSLKESAMNISAQLRRITSNIITSSSQVSSSSEQSAKGSEALAEGTTRQAAAIEELSASLNNISTKINETSDNACNARKISENASELLDQQNEHMDQMLDAMESIAEKSSQIKNIIKTIDDIAFQTNILALNAAVEAARAGTAGRGFSVVADEVRNLASKSAEAVKNTSDLIAAAIDAVNKGEEVADKNASSFEEVKGMFAKTKLMIDEIASAAENQSVAVGQITGGINEISEVIQQNSATAQQIAASCEELSGQAHMLNNEMSKFKV